MLGLGEADWLLTSTAGCGATVDASPDWLMALVKAVADVVTAVSGEGADVAAIMQIYAN